MPVLAGPPTFYRDVLPILQKSLSVSVIVRGEMAPMALVTYRDARPLGEGDSRGHARVRKMPSLVCGFLLRGNFLMTGH